jgi:hypothetical protein
MTIFTLGMTLKQIVSKLKIKKLFQNLIMKLIQKFCFKLILMRTKFKIQNWLLVVYYLFRHPRRFFQALFPKAKLLEFQKLSFRRMIRWSFATLPRRIVSSILIALLIIGPLTFLFKTKTAEAAWWPPAQRACSAPEVL